VKLFISWSGERSHALGDALHDWIPLVLHYVEPWLSQADIEAGQRWAEQVAKELEASNFGIICVTRENVGSPWVLFEAGALAKSMQGSRVIPLLLDLEVRDITGPLAQFQAKKVERTGLLEVIQSLNQLATPHSVPEDRVMQLFDALWPEFEKKVTAIPMPSSQARHARPQPEILEELVTSVRSLDSRFREIADEGPRGLRPRRRIHPLMVAEISHQLGGKRGDPIALLIMASLFRDEMPWVYELGIEAYRAARDGTPEEALAARRRFQKSAEVMLRGPFGPEEMGMEPRMMHMMVRELDHLLEPEPEPEPEVETESSEAFIPKPRRKKGEKPS